MPKKKPKTKAGKKGKMETVMHEFKKGALHSGSKEGPKVKSRKQAIAIGLKQSGQSSAKSSGKGRSHKKRDIGEALST